MSRIGILQREHDYLFILTDDVISKRRKGSRIRITDECAESMGETCTCVMPYRLARDLPLFLDEFAAQRWTRELHLKEILSLYFIRTLSRLFLHFYVRIFLYRYIFVTERTCTISRNRFVRSPARYTAHSTSVVSSIGKFNLSR